jgi:hypothetical protein
MGGGRVSGYLVHFLGMDRIGLDTGTDSVRLLGVLILSKISIVCDRLEIRDSGLKMKLLILFNYSRSFLFTVPIHLS